VSEKRKLPNLSYDPPEGYPGHQAYTFVICHLSTSLTSVSISLSPAALDMYLCGCTQVQTGSTEILCSRHILIVCFTEIAT
jgi:hypothetical protein